MKLIKICANGFKSFADKIELNIDFGITGIVGPNGSGKSNIVDAVRWVLGEQSVKALRGDNNMSDVIFSGSKSRDEAKRCYVALTFDNSDHYLKSDFDEIEIKRVLYKTGENDYYLNNTKVRLKDIIDLFIDSGASRESFNIISQGNVKDVINSKAIDRRIIFESAAGVLKYKKKKEESLRKLDKTKDNIDSLDLLINEVNMQVTPLKSQAEKAKKYNEYYEELKNTEIGLLIYDIEHLNEEYINAKEQLETLKDKILLIENENLKDNTKIEQIKLKNLKIDELISEKSEEIIKLNKVIEELKSEKQLTLERQKYKVDDIKLQNNIISLKEKVLENDNKINKTKLEINKVNKELDNLLSSLDETNGENDTIINNLAILKQKNMELDKNMINIENKIDIISNNIANNSRVPYAVKAVLENKFLKGIHNTIGNIIKSDPIYNIALDTALSVATNFIIVDTMNDAKNAIEYIKKIKAGKATFFPIDIIKARYIDDKILNKINNLSGFISVASDLVQVDKIYENIIKNQLGNVIIVDNLYNGKIIAETIGYRNKIVTLSGDTINAGGSLTGGFNKAASVINDKKELQELQQKQILLQNKKLSQEEEEKNIINQNNDLNEKIVELNKNISIKKEIIFQKEQFINSLEEENKSLNLELSGINSLVHNNTDKELDKIMNDYYEFKKKVESKEIELNALKNEKDENFLLLTEEEKSSKMRNSKYFELQNNLKNLEINISKTEIRLDNCLNNLNEEYNMTYEKAKDNYLLIIDVKEAREKVQELKKKIKLLGEVNLAAINEYERINSRYEFLNKQRDDLVISLEKLNNIISEMDEIMVERFKNTFKLIRNEYKNIFKKLFKGGEGDLILTNPDNILETGIEIIAEPPGKKVSSIALLSGGEKTLTALSLLFAIINVKTVPFCILDEVEESLDEANVDVFGKYLNSLKNNSQFIIITHKKRTMEYADTLYGITMQESGVSKLVSVKLNDLI